MKLCVIGTGYIGLVGAAVFAEWGNNVTGVDIDQAKIDRIMRGDMPIYEPGLQEVVMTNLNDGRLTFTTDLAQGIKDAEVIFICVGTPQSDTGAADLKAVETVATQIAQYLDTYKLIVVKSTVPVGTNEYVRELIKNNLKTSVEFDMASNPEFLREGYSVDDMRNPDRTVIGSDSQKALDLLKQLYSHLKTPILECDFRSAELIKYASNAFLATKISFINEISQLCDRSGADVSVVAKGMGLDTRIGSRFLQAGIGYGGSCFPKDVAALYKTSTDQAYDFKLLRGVMEVNERQKKFYFSKITKALGKNLSGKTFAVLGLSFKEATDDVRDSVAIEIVRLLRGAGAHVKVYDPAAMENAKQQLGEESIYYANSISDAMEGADALCILTEWAEFKELNLSSLHQLSTKMVFDGRNVLDKKAVQDAGLIYFAIGKVTNGSTLIAEKTASAVLNGKN
jgi:UDPglucose 6-dehydrogenase